MAQLKLKGDRNGIKGKFKQQFGNDADQHLGRMRATELRGRPNRNYISHRNGSVSVTAVLVIILIIVTVALSAALLM